MEKFFPKGPFRISDLGGGGFDPDGRSKTSTPPKNVGRILIPPLINPPDLVNH